MRNDTCKMCLNVGPHPYKATLFHILNNCPSFLGENERMTWRHNSVLSYITMTLNENKPSHIEIYADLEGYNINGLTLPPHVTVTSSRPDLVIIDTSTTPQTVYLYELTVCFEDLDNIQAATTRKFNIYSALATDIEDNGFQCKNLPFEVGSRGHLTLANKTKLSIIHKLCKPRLNFTKFCQNICKTSLLCSYTIYLSRNHPWTGAPLLLPAKQPVMTN